MSNKQEGRRFVAYPKIGQYRNIVKAIHDHSTYVGRDENGDPVFDGTQPKPVITFTGSVKLHGSNMGVCYNSIAGQWVQSRKNVITSQSDNAGSAFFAESKSEVFQELFDTLIKDNDIDVTTRTVAIFGEWCGGNVQKGVSINGLPKMFVIFGAKDVPITTSLGDDGEEIEKGKWIDISKLRSPDNNIYNILDYDTYSIDIDFDKPELAQDKMYDLVMAVEKECPVGKAFGRKLGENTTTGEGIVWVGYDGNDRYMFKTKGDKHQSSKTKTIAPIDVEKVANVKQFVEYSVTENRLEQGIEQVFTISGEEPTIKKMGEFLRWVSNDVVSEEIDTLSENGLEPKDVKKMISDKARNWFIGYLDKRIGL